MALVYNFGFGQRCSRSSEFNELSKNAVQGGINSPRALNYNLIDAQQARRVLDRLMGYKLSPLLSQKIRSKLSAGRVQSVVLKLVVDREKENSKFCTRRILGCERTFEQGK